MTYFGAAVGSVEAEKLHDGWLCVYVCEVGVSVSVSVRDLIFQGQGQREQPELRNIE
jgi:hypothetical protein